MENTLREIVSRVAEVHPDFSADANLRDELDVDSFRSAEISFEIERVFGVKVPDDKYALAQSLNDILRMLQSL